MCIISVITSAPSHRDVRSTCSTNWCTCMSSRIRIVKAFSSEIKSHRCFHLPTRSCYDISVFYNLLWLCFIIVTVRVTFKFIHLERFRLGADEDLGIFFVTDKSDNRTGRWLGYWFIRKWSGWISGKESSLYGPVFVFSYSSVLNENEKYTHHLARYRFHRPSRIWGNSKTSCSRLRML